MMITSTGNNPFTKFACLFYIYQVTSQLQKYVVLSMLPSYSPCKILLTLKSCVGLLDPAVESGVCSDVNLDGFAF